LTRGPGRGKLLWKREILAAFFEPTIEKQLVDAPGDR